MLLTTSDHWRNQEEITILETNKWKQKNYNQNDTGCEVIAVQEIL